MVVRPSGSGGRPRSVVIGSVESRAAAPAGSVNSVKELPNKPLAADSQITTATVSPTAIFNSGGGASDLKRLSNPSGCCAKSVVSTASSILTMSNAIWSPLRAWAMTSSPDGPPPQPARPSARSQAQQTARKTGKATAPQPSHTPP